MSPEGVVHVCSVVVHTRADAADAVSRAIAAVDDAEVRASDGGGRLVVLIESADEGGLFATWRRLETLDDVLSVALVYHQVDAG
jgi:nitrate reductase NapAB chaperone NapD